MPIEIECLEWTEDVQPTQLEDLLNGNASIQNIHLTKLQTQFWCIPLPEKNNQLESCFSLLTREEKERADRFRHEGAKKQFIVGHGVIHILLKQFLGTQYDEVEWMESEHHKPYIQLSDSTKPLEYNLSHCEDYISVSIGAKSQGIDIENIRPLNDLEGISRQVFTEQEVDQVFETNDVVTQMNTFYKFWTCKEAALKANGTGFMKDPKSLELIFISESKQNKQPVYWSNAIPGHSFAWTENLEIK